MIAKGDYAQASEKLWGSVAESIKSTAEIRGWRHYNHRDLRLIIGKLLAETGDKEIVTFFSSAESLHSNYHENWMKREVFEVSAENARKLLKKLEELLAKGK